MRLWIETFLVVTVLMNVIFWSLAFYWHRRRNQARKELDEIIGRDDVTGHIVTRTELAEDYRQYHKKFSGNSHDPEITKERK